MLRLLFKYGSVLELQILYIFSTVLNLVCVLTKSEIPIITFNNDIFVQQTIEMHFS